MFGGFYFGQLPFGGAAFVAAPATETTTPDTGAGAPSSIPTRRRSGVAHVAPWVAPYEPPERERARLLREQIAREDEEVVELVTALVAVLGGKR